MKYFFTACWAIVCIVVLFIGHSYWKERTTVKGMPNEVTSSVKADPKEAQVDDTRLLALTKNWPDTAKETFQQSMKEKKAFKISFVGSSALH
jgi:amino acid permease